MEKNCVNGIVAVAAAATLACSLGVTAEATTRVYTNSDESIYSYTDDGVRQESFAPEQDSGTIQHIGDGYYYVDRATGAYTTGFFIYGGALYYADETGRLAEKGLKNIYDPMNGTTHTYYFNENHTAATGFLRLNDKLYYFNEMGQMQFGHFQTYRGWCYAKENGKLVCDDSVKTAGGQYLVFDSNGIQIN